jgi:HlyD family secretion protein
MNRRPIQIAAVIALVAALAAIGLGSCSKPTAAKSSKKQSYEYATIGKGSIESTVTSSGTLAVVSEVNVLAQMSGRIEKVYVDYNERVRRGQLLATLNTDLLKLQEKSARASVDKCQANYELQELAVQNAKALFDKGLLSEYDYKSAAATLKACKADLESAGASLEQIQTEINQYAYITSPIDGIVLSRDVDAGSSVTGGASSSSTALFTLAASLGQMEIEAKVDELDISSIKVGQAVRFTVEANPGMTFDGAVKEVRLVPETSDNLVYYYVIILAGNEAGKLLPGMTASVTFIKQKKDGVLTVPSAALRFSPTTLSAEDKARALFVAALPTELGAEQRQKAIADYDERVKSQAAAKQSGNATAQAGGLTSLMSGRMMGGPGGPGGPGQWNGNRSSAKAAGALAQEKVRKPLWYVDDAGKLAAIMVELGLGDATKTEVSGPAAVEGRKVILKVKAE